MLLLVSFSSSLLLPVGRGVRLTECARVARSSAFRKHDKFPNGPARHVVNAGSAFQICSASPKPATRAGNVEARLEADTPLEEADDGSAIQGEDYLVKVLLDASLEEADGSCDLTLRRGIRIGDLDLIKAHLNAGASLERETGSFLTPLESAIHRVRT